MKAELGWCHFGKGTSLPATHPEYQINPYQKATQVLHCSGALPSEKKKNWVSNWHQHYRTPWSAWPGKLFSVSASGPARNPYNPLDPTRADASEDPNPKEGDLSVIPPCTKTFPIYHFQFWWRNSLRTKKNIASGFWAPCHTKPASCTTLPWGWAKSITVLRYAWKTFETQRLEMGRWEMSQKSLKITWFRGGASKSSGNLTNFCTVER